MYARLLDMARAAEIFAAATLTIADDRKDYGEPRWGALRAHGWGVLDVSRRLAGDEGRPPAQEGYSVPIDRTSVAKRRIASREACIFHPAK